MMTSEDFLNEATDLLDNYFPKNECKERGQALVLIAELSVKLQQAGNLK